MQRTANPRTPVRFRLRPPSSEHSDGIHRPALLAWADAELEAPGLIAEPLPYDVFTGRGIPIAWTEAFVLFGRRV